VYGIYRPPLASRNMAAAAGGEGGGAGQVYEPSQMYNAQAEEEFLDNANASDGPFEAPPRDVIRYRSMTAAPAPCPPHDFQRIGEGKETGIGTFGLRAQEIMETHLRTWAFPYQCKKCQKTTWWKFHYTPKEGHVLDTSPEARARARQEARERIEAAGATAHTDLRPGHRVWEYAL